MPPQYTSYYQTFLNFFCRNFNHLRKFLFTANPTYTPLNLYSKSKGSEFFSLGVDSF